MWNECTKKQMQMRSRTLLNLQSTSYLIGPGRARNFDGMKDEAGWGWMEGVLAALDHL